MTALEPIRVLLIEDNPGDSRLVAKQLEAFPVVLKAVGSLQAARQWLLDNRVDAILLDLHLPDGHGLELMTILRRIDHSAPIVVLTGSTDDDLGVEAVRRGAEDYLKKNEIEANALHRALRHAIERRKLQREVYHSTVWRNADAMVVLTERGEIVFSNPAAERLFGRSASELAGQKLDIPGGSEDEATHIENAVTGTIVASVRTTDTTWLGAPARLAFLRDVTESKLAEQAREASERRMDLVIEQLPITIWTSDEDLQISSCRGLLCRRGNGNGNRPLDELLADVEGNFRAAHKEALEAGECSISFEIGELKYEGLVRKTALDDAMSSLIGFAFDVTERRRLEAQLLQAQKLEAVGRLAGGIAHDFNNSLTAISGFSELILGALDDADPIAADVKEILSAARHAGTLTRQLLTFSRRRDIDPRSIKVAEVNQATERLLRRLLGDDIHFVLNAAPGLWEVFIDPSAYEQVLVNLCVNSRDAMPDGGTLTIYAENFVVESERASPIGEDIEVGDYVVISVSDTGVGMSKEVRERIFEPFFTTKPETQGTGLGLSICYGIVSQAGGYLWVDSEVGVGTTFEVWLPRSAQDGQAMDRIDESPLPRGSETILVVEDARRVRRLTVRTLMGLGYRVMSCGNGHEALLQFEQVEGRIDLLLTDVAMPGMSGPQLVKQLREREFEVKVLYTSGYPDPSVFPHWNGGRTHLLPKPFTRLELATKVRERLDM